jgi:hypothetical protein
MPQPKAQPTAAIPSKREMIERFAKLTATSASDLTKVATALHLTSQQLETELGARLLETAAGSLDRVASAIKDARPKELQRALQGLAREQPAFFIGSALALGFAGARFLKSSAAPADRAQPTTGGIHAQQEPATERTRQGARRGSPYPGRKTAGGAARARRVH